MEEGLELNSLLEGHLSQPESSVKLRSARADFHSQKRIALRKVLQRDLIFAGEGQ